MKYPFFKNNVQHMCQGVSDSCEIPFFWLGRQLNMFSMQNIRERKLWEKISWNQFWNQIFYLLHFFTRNFKHSLLIGWWNVACFVLNCLFEMQRPYPKIISDPHPSCFWIVWKGECEKLFSITTFTTFTTSTTTTTTWTWGSFFTPQHGSSPDLVQELELLLAHDRDVKCNNVYCRNQKMAKQNA